MKNISIIEFLASIDRVKMQSDLMLITQVVTRAKSEGKFPSGWFIPIRNWCVDNGLDCPEYLFKWHDVKAEGKQNAYTRPATAVASFQEGGNKNVSHGDTA
jgi:hypothetical protein